MEFWKCIGCIILTVTYGKKGCMLLGGNNISDKIKAPGSIERDVCGKKYLFKVHFSLYSILWHT